MNSLMNEKVARANTLYMKLTGLCPVRVKQVSLNSLLLVANKKLFWLLIMTETTPQKLISLVDKECLLEHELHSKGTDS